MKPLFLALKAKLNDYEKIQSDFSKLIKGKWVPGDNLHITINYFGDKFTLEELLEKLPSLITPVPELQLSGLGYFEKNKILYIKSEVKGLTSLSEAISNEFSLPQTKEFIPHVTLMRIKSITDIKGFKEMIDNYKDEELGSVATTPELMQSEIRHPGGAVYTSLQSF
ncbi:RNA 2',3'-cyclic phosphodiesterase [Sulfurimonas marina]|uniref:RNA 2',3'-cyclic phosphodiesterase n=1 Tax=Sulfurimonas marina TaxID=2590551 RepID=A0A7M1AZX0_9BACT|nr:RNA 2',3'-cyclic phosphodiesterase [Sulfurimonas marina]QOP42088.1 RNA 2',3'-cyclic phosphodiesterase [Sulfurimonas marina]